MKLIKTLLPAVTALIFTACSVNQVDAPKKELNTNLKEDRDYLAIVGRTNTLHIIDSKEQKVIRSCNLKGTHGAGAMVVSPNGQEAYVLQDRMQAIYGYDLNTCENTFSTSLTQGNTRGIAIFSIAISKDGKELYTIYSPSQKSIDQYKILDPVFAVFNPKAGLNAKATRTFKAPRQTTILMTGYNGEVYASGPDIYKLNPKNGEVNVAAKLRNWTKAKHSQPDVLAMWPIGNVSNEFLTMYTAAKFADEKQSMETAEFVWGATRIDLKTGEVEQENFAPIESIMFTGMTHPKDSNLLYGVLTDLTKFDRKNQKVIKRVYLDHTYYCLNFATDGSKLYIGGTYNDIAIYNPDTLDKIGNIALPSGDTGASTLQVFRVSK